MITPRTNVEMCPKYEDPVPQKDIQELKKPHVVEIVKI